MMWPQTLQMSEDDCRSTLRRKELETYSNVIGVFRAQGGLSDRKAKLLEELQLVFHISQDRHRAEARRVANDELLSTIAKAVSGPNTWQDWAREGRRPYPMLPRVAPQTALGWIANKLANEAAIENAKLPLPADTAAAAAEEQAAILAAVEAASISNAEKYLVTSDPFKTPDIPAAGIKKNLKRCMTDGHQTSGSSSNKKRNTNDAASTNKHKHITGTTNTLSANSNRKAAALNRIQQQRFFYQQQQKAKKLAKAAAGKREKLPGASKCGRKSKKYKEQLRQEQEYQQQQELLQQQQQQQQQQEFDGYENYTSTNSSANINISDETILEDSKFTSNQKPIYLPLIMPQIAASKRDITRNLTKLQIPGNSPSSQLAPSIGSPISTVGKSIVDTKLTPLSTPVQKYIVEDRQPPIVVQHSPISNLSMTGGPTAATAATITPTTSGTQFITMPHLPVSNKLRPVNTAILPVGTKLSTTTKKLTTILSATLLSPGATTNTPFAETLLSNANASTQLYNVMDGSNAIQVQSNLNQSNISTPSTQQPPPTAPTHTPPAVIQLHSNEVARVGAQQQQQQQPIATTTTPSQSKVLTTKILPIVFGNSPSSAGNSIKNGNASVTSNFVTSPSGTIIKSLPSSVLVSGQQTGNITTSGSTSFSNFGTGGQVYRKHPNILKSTSSLRSSSNNSGGPQIISNIRLTPAITTTPSATNPTQSNIFQPQLRISPSSTGIRTSVKICQSSNGKVFIQPANVDPTKITKITSSPLAQRLLSTNLLGSSSSSSNNNSPNVSLGGSNSVTNQSGSPHRIAIQKVQIIPAPLSSNVSNSLTQNSQQRLTTTTLSLGATVGGSNKTNIFVPTASNLRNTKSLGPLTLTKGSFSSNTMGGFNDTNSSVGGIGYSKPSPSSVVVIDASNKLNSQNTKISTSNLNLNRSISNSHMITEDTPVDIIVDGSTDITTTPLTTVNETSSITAVLASNLMDNSTHQVPEKQRTSTMVPITVLSTTDWEMELDQATAASSMHQQQQQQQQSSGTIDIPSGQTNLKLHEQSESELETAETIIIDDSFEDVIIEEEEEEIEDEEAEGQDIEDEEQDETTEELTHIAHNMEVATENDIIMVDDVESLVVDNKVEHERGARFLVEEEVQKTNEINEYETEFSYGSLGNPIFEDNITKANTVTQESCEEYDQNNVSAKNNEKYEASPKEVNDSTNKVQMISMLATENDEEASEIKTASTMEHHIRNHDDKEDKEIRISPTHIFEREITPLNDINLIDDSDEEEASEHFLKTTTARTTATTVSASLVSVQDFDEPKTNLIKNNDEKEIETSDGTNCSTDQ